MLHGKDDSYPESNSQTGHPPTPSPEPERTTGDTRFPKGYAPPQVRPLGTLPEATGMATSFELGTEPER